MNTSFWFIWRKTSWDKFLGQVPETSSSTGNTPGVCGENYTQPGGHNRNASTESTEHDNTDTDSEHADGHDRDAAVCGILSANLGLFMATFRILRLAVCAFIFVFSAFVFCF